MTTLQVRNLPDDVHAVLRSRAAARGISLTALVVEVLRQSAEEPTTDEWLTQWRRRRAGAGPARDIDVLGALDAARDEYDPR